MEVRWGYTLERLDHLARLVVSINRGWWPAGDRRDQYEVAWMGIVECLCAATEQPDERDLLTAGRNALSRDIIDTMRHRGYRGRKYDGDGRRFAAYWEWHAAPSPDPATAVVERVALRQVLPKLTPAQRECLAALAATDDHQAAAMLCGRSKNGYLQLISQGRRRWDRWWYEGETPPRRRKDKRVGRR